MTNASVLIKKHDEAIGYLNDCSIPIKDKLQYIAGIYDQDTLRNFLYSYRGSLPSVTIAIIKKVDDESYLKDFFIHVSKSRMSNMVSIGFEIIKKINNVRLLYELEDMTFTPNILNPIIRNRINYLKYECDDSYVGSSDKIIRLRDR